MKREELLNEIELRKAIKNLLPKSRLEIVKESVSHYSGELKLRKMIRRVISESGLAGKIPHASTGLNVLEDLLGNIVPTLEREYKKLTTDPEQRESFRAHILNAIINTIAPPKSLRRGELEDYMVSQDNVDLEGDQDEFNINEEALRGLSALLEDATYMQPSDDISMDVGDDSEAPEDKFIDIDGDGEPDPREEFGAGLDYEEVTGRNVAYDAFEKIENQIIDAFEKLANAEDRQEFYDYLLTNTKMYFDKFEDEIQTDLSEPTTDAYEAEMSDQADNFPQGEPANPEQL